MDSLKLMGEYYRFVADHVAAHGATSNIHETKHGFYVILNHGKWSIDETVNLDNLPDNIQVEYLHCKLHGLGAKLIAHIYPAG